MSRTLLLSVSCFFCGCVSSEDNVGLVEQMDGILPNGVSLNGILPNGILPNGILPNDVALNGILPNGILPNGAVVGIVGMGAPLGGADVVGSTWTGELSDGSTLSLRIDAAAQLTGTNADLWSYLFSA